MKKIISFIIVLLPIFVLGQKYEFKIGGNITYNAPYLNDVINPEAEGLTRTELLAPEYLWMFSHPITINGIFSRYRSVEPKFGVTLNGIVNIKLVSAWSFRTGIELEYVSFTRIVEEKLASYFDFQNYDATLKLLDVQYENSIKTVNFSCPLNIEYNFKSKGISVFGGVKYTARIFDNLNYDDNSEKFISFDRQGAIYALPFRNRYYFSANLGVIYKVYNKLNAELNMTSGITNMYQTDTGHELSFKNGREDELPKFNKQRSLFQQLAIGISYRLF